MPLQSKAIRVVLAQPSTRQLPMLSETISGVPDVDLFEIRGTMDVIWRQAITQSPDVTVVFCPVVGDGEKRAVSRILHGADTQLLLITESISSVGIPFTHKRMVLWTLEPGQGFRSDELIQKVIQLGKQHQAASTAQKAQQTAASVLTGALYAPVPVVTQHSHIIAIGASTGGTEALAKLFHLLPKNLPGIVVVQHMPPVFTKMYADRLNNELPFQVTEAADNVQVLPGTIHIAPGGRQMRVVKRGPNYYTSLGGEEKVGGHCPSVDVLFESVAGVAGGSAVGIILTGMGADGASGMLTMRRRGGFTIGQDEASSVVYGMPRKAYEYGGVVRQAALSDIPGVLIKHLTS